MMLETAKKTVASNTTELIRLTENIAHTKASMLPQLA